MGTGAVEERVMDREARRIIQSIATRAGVYRRAGAAALEQLYDVVIPVYADLEEEPILGFTLGRLPDAIPSHTRTWLRRCWLIPADARRRCRPPRGKKHAIFPRMSGSPGFRR